MAEPAPINPPTANPELAVCAIPSCGHSKWKHSRYSDDALWCRDCNTGTRVEGPCFVFSFHAIGCMCRWHKHLVK